MEKKQDSYYFDTFIDCAGHAVEAVKILRKCVDDYDPEVLVLSGGPCHIPELCEEIARYVRGHAWTPWGQVEIRVAQNPEASVLWGLAHMAAMDVRAPQT